ncbi:MAG: tRNA (adenosine(37)-N6)-threonylcarbamoyltransferase complex ATPase subunit type 1 TsaE [Ignavibacteria bacterium GWF2_33_9]|nr:MAG: tRNA (adenosine(37)-N6)-threonylcarbamoyltransferase complex ATPase subunit type 1 TsaE [Ignavibacteria bacterium GWF2_33_9]
MIIYTNSEEETIHTAEKFAAGLTPGDIVALYGDLGTGKTEFTKGICNYFGVEEIVTSPTFTIVNKYNAKINKKPLTIYHIDLYRLEKEAELLEIGFNEYLNDDEAITIIEWSDRTNQIPTRSIKVKIMYKPDEDDFRIIEIIHPELEEIGV